MNLENSDNHRQDDNNNDSPRQVDNNEKNTKASKVKIVATIVSMVLFLVLGSVLMIGYFYQPLLVSTSGQSSVQAADSSKGSKDGASSNGTNSGGSSGVQPGDSESKDGAVTGDTGTQNGNSSAPAEGSTPASDNSGSSSGTVPPDEKKKEDSNPNPGKKVLNEPFVGKKYADAALALNIASEIGLEIMAFFDGLYGADVCQVDVDYNVDVSWVYTVKTPDGTYKYLLPLNTCILARA